MAAVSRAAAFVRGRDYVIPEDVADIFRDTVAHRLVLTPGCDGTQQDPLGEVLHMVHPPGSGSRRGPPPRGLCAAPGRSFAVPPFDIGYLACFLLALALTLPVLGMLLSLPAMLRCRLELQAEPTGGSGAERPAGGWRPMGLSGCLWRR